MHTQRAPYHKHAPQQRWTIDFTRVNGDGGADPQKNHVELRLEESPGGYYVVVGVNNLRLINGTEVIIHAAGARRLAEELLAYVDRLTPAPVTVENPL